MTAAVVQAGAPLGEVLDHVCSELRKREAWLAITGDFPVEIAELLSSSGLTALCLPCDLGGRGAELTDLVTAVERIAEVDAATAWCLFIMGTAPWLLCHAAPELVGEVYAKPDSRIAGALAPTGTLSRASHDYVLSGRWTFGSALNACDWVAVHAVFADEPDPRSAFVLVPVSEVSYREPWDGLGLAASGSGTFGICDLAVPAHRLVPSFSGPSLWPGSAFLVPFRATFAACAAVLIGIASEMLTVFGEYASSKRPVFGSGALAQQAHVRSAVAESWGAVAAARALLYLTVGNLERACAEGAPSSRPQAELRIAMNVARASCLGVVDRLHLAAGGHASTSQSRFTRLLRDAHTASQHHMFSGAVTEAAGSVLLGQDAPEGQL